MAEINAKILRGISAARIAAAYGVSASAIFRHRSNHMSADLAAVQQGRGILIQEEIEGLQEEARLLQERAELSGDVKAAIAAVTERRHLLELKARLKGELLPEGSRTVNNVVNVNVSPEVAKRMAETFLARQKLLKSPETVDA